MLNVPPSPTRSVVTVEFIHFCNDLVFNLKPYSIHFCPKVLTSSKNVFAEIRIARLHLNYAFNAFPQSLWSVFLSFFFYIFITSLLGVCCWHYTRNPWIKTLFLWNQQLQAYVSKGHAFSFCLAMTLYIPYTSFCLERSCMFHFALRWLCIYITCSADGHIQCSVCSNSGALPIYLFRVALSFGLSLIV